MRAPGVLARAGYDMSTSGLAMSQWGLGTHGHPCQIQGIRFVELMILDNLSQSGAMRVSIQG
jgi:hypothetical protein